MMCSVHGLHQAVNAGGRDVPKLNFWVKWLEQQPKKIEDTFPILNFCSYKGELPACSLTALHFFLFQGTIFPPVVSHIPPSIRSPKKLPWKR